MPKRLENLGEGRSATGTAKGDNPSQRASTIVILDFDLEVFTPHFSTIAGSATLLDDLRSGQRRGSEDATKARDARRLLGEEEVGRTATVR